MELKSLLAGMNLNGLYGSNRTFMELKYTFWQMFVSSIGVLIVPLWN